MIAAIPPQAVQAPIAAPRSRSGNAATMIASELGVSSAPAAPCSARAAISASIVGATAHTSESTPNAADADREHPPLAVDVAERAADQDQRAEREQVRVRHPLLRRQPAAEVALDRRQRDVDDRPVDRRHAGAEDRRDQRQPLAPAHPRAGRSAPAGSGTRKRRDPPGPSRPRRRRPRRRSPGTRAASRADRRPCARPRSGRSASEPATLLGPDGFLGPQRPVAEAGRLRRGVRVVGRLAHVLVARPRSRTRRPRACTPRA